MTLIIIEKILSKKDSMKKILVSGSTAFDYNLQYNGDFSEQFSNGISSWVNMSLLTPGLDKTFGGTGLNICYSLALLSESPVLITSVGGDFVFEWMIEEKVCLDYIHRDNTVLSSSAYIVSDEAGNQMSFFHPGAMGNGENSTIKYVREEIHYAIVAPNKKEAMIQHVYELSDKSARVFLDPGQQITDFSKEELLPLFDITAYLIVNQYEYKELMQKVEMDEEELKHKFNKIIVTYGAQGSQIIDAVETIHIPALEPSEIVDTTGAGDAYRAGILKGMVLWYDWKTSAQIATVMAKYCVEHHGSQNHFFNIGIISEDMKQAFWVEVDLYRGVIS